MQTIVTILGILFVLWPILVIAGLIKPAWLKQPNRKQVLGKGVLIWVGVLIYRDQGAPGIIRFVADLETWR